MDIKYRKRLCEEMKAYRDNDMLWLKKYEALKAELEAVKRERDEAVEKYNRMRENAKILSDAVTRLERERDAAIEILRDCGECDGCKYERIDANDEPCFSCVRCWQYEENDRWEWRGVQENGGAEDGQD